MKRDVTSGSAADGGVSELVRSRQHRRANTVLAVCCVGLLVGLGVVLGRVVHLQVDTPERLVEHAGDRTSRMLLSAPRGDVRDRRGRLLVGSTTGYRLFIDPHELLGLEGLHAEPDVDAVHERLEGAFETLDELVGELSAVIGEPSSVIGERLVGQVFRAVERARRGERLRYARASGVLDDAALARAERLTRAHVHLERVPVRHMVAGESVAQIVGFVGADGVGLIGSERAHDAHLRPRHGHVDYVRDARGGAMWMHADGYAMPARGGDLRLSIDARLQQIATAELERGVSDAGAAGGLLVLIDPMSGEVLALADVIREIGGVTPFTREAADAAERDGTWVRFDVMKSDPLREVHPAFGRNRLLGDVYEPGSTFKPFMWSATVAYGEARPDEVFRTHGGSWTTPYGRRIEDVRRADEMTWRDVLVNSSNVGMAQGVARLSEREARAAVLRFGFGSRTGVGLAGESRGVVTSERDWNDYTQTSVAFGYEIAVTPLQLVRAFAVFARGGMLAGTLPDLTLEATAHDSASLRVIRRVLEPHVALETRDALVEVAERMLGLMRLPDRYPDEPAMRYTMFGKSGTAQIARPDGRGHLERQYRSSFVAGAPVEEPRLVVLVIIDDPSPELVRARRGFGSWVAGPVTARVLRRGLEYMGVAADREEALAGADASARVE